MGYIINTSKLTEEQKKLYKEGLCLCEDRAEIKCPQGYSCLKAYDSEKTEQRKPERFPESDLICKFSLPQKVRKELEIE